MPTTKFLKGAPAQDSTIIVSESDLARQLNRSVRSPLDCFAARGQVQPRHCHFGILALESLITGDPLVSPAR